MIIGRKSKAAAVSDVYRLGGTGIAVGTEAVVHPAAPCESTR